MLYVGKAKRLRSRVRSYFGADPLASVQDAGADAPGRGSRDDRRAERGARARARVEPDQGAPPAVQHRAARRQVVPVHQGHGAGAVPAGARHAPAAERRRALLRPVHRRGRDAAGAERREAHLHRALVQLRHAARDAGACVSRLLHQAVQGAVHPAPDAGRVSGDDRRGARVPRRAHGRGDPAGAGAHGRRRRRTWTSSVPPSCATRCSI